MKKIILLFFLGMLCLSAQSQHQSAKDSMYVEQLIDHTLKSLSIPGVTNYLYLFSDAGIIILYSEGEKVKGMGCHYVNGTTPELQHLKLNRKRKLSYAKCLGMAKMDTSVNFSNCFSFAHAFHRVTFSIQANNHRLRGAFTTDCGNALKSKGMYEIYDIYQKFITSR